MSTEAPHVRDEAARGAVVFDMDGVLVLTSAVHVRVWEEYLAEIDHDPGPDGAWGLLGRRGTDVLADLHPELSEDDRRAIAARLEDRSDQLHLETVPPRAPGAVRLLRELRARETPLALATSAHRVGVDLLLGELVDSFDTVVTAEDVTRGKPDPAIYLTAARRLGVAPERCTVVEDAPAGIRAAVAAGMRVIAVEGTAPTERLLEAGAIRVATTLNELRVEDICWNVS